MKPEDTVRRQTKVCVKRLIADTKKGKVPSAGLIGLFAILCSDQGDAGVSKRTLPTFVKAGGVGAVINALRKFPSNIETQKSGIPVLSYALFNNRKLVGDSVRAGTIDIFLHSLTSSELVDNEETCELAMKSVSSLIGAYGKSGTSLDAGDLQVIVTVMKQHLDGTEIMKAGCKVLYEVLQVRGEDEEEIKNMLIDAGTITIVMEGLDRQCKHGDIKESDSAADFFMPLLVLAIGSPRALTLIAESEGAIKLCVAAMERWESSTLTQWQACGLLCALINNGEAPEKLSKAGVIPPAVNAVKQFVKDTKCVSFDTIFDLLSHLADGCIDNIKSIKNAGAIPSVLRVIQGLDFIETGGDVSSRARVSAMELLEHLLRCSSNEFDLDGSVENSDRIRSKVALEILANNGIEVVLEAMRQNADSETLQAGCDLLEQLSHGDDGEPSFTDSSPAVFIAAGGKGVLTHARDDEHISQGTRDWIEIALVCFEKYLQAPHCQKCFSAPKRLLLCARCGEVKYCSKKCQQADWKVSHKKSCMKSMAHMASSGAKTKA